MALLLLIVLLSRNFQVSFAESNYYETETRGFQATADWFATELDENLSTEAFTEDVSEAEFAPRTVPVGGGEEVAVKGKRLHIPRLGRPTQDPEAPLVPFFANVTPTDRTTQPGNKIAEVTEMEAADRHLSVVSGPSPALSKKRRPPSATHFAALLRGFTSDWPAPVAAPRLLSRSTPASGGRVRHTFDDALSSTTAATPDDKESPTQSKGWKSLLSKLQIRSKKKNGTSITTQETVTDKP